MSQRTDAIVDLVSGYQAFTADEPLTQELSQEAPAATTTFCAFTVSYMFTRATVADNC